MTQEGPESSPDKYPRCHRPERNFRNLVADSILLIEVGFAHVELILTHYSRKIVLWLRKNSAAAAVLFTAAPQRSLLVSTRFPIIARKIAGNSTSFRLFSKSLRTDRK